MHSFFHVLSPTNMHITHPSYCWGPQTLLFLHFLFYMLCGQNLQYVGGRPLGLINHKNVHVMIVVTAIICALQQALIKHALKFKLYCSSVSIFWRTRISLIVTLLHWIILPECTSKQLSHSNKDHCILKTQKGDSN